MRVPGISPAVEERKELRFCPKGKIAMPTGATENAFDIFLASDGKNALHFFLGTYGVLCTPEYVQNCKAIP